MSEKFDFSKIKDQKNYKDKIKIREQLKYPLYLPAYEEILMAFPDRFGSKGCADFEYDDFCKKESIFEFFNREFIAKLVDYLEKEIIKYKGTKENPVTILEVGAGSGRLSYFLENEIKNRKLENMVKTTPPTDSKEYKIEVLPVESISYKEAIKKYAPKIVIVSWLPQGEDWTLDFRDFDCIKEYILIGEPEICGTGDTYDDILIEEGKFRTTELSDVKKYQICKTDHSIIRHSTTLSFKREN